MRKSGRSELYSDVLSQFIERASLLDNRVSINATCDFCRQKFDNEFTLYKSRFNFENLEINPATDRVISKLNLQREIFDADSKGLITQFSRRLVSKNTFEKLILDNTSVITENNQVFIVTNLPRASIDSLLASKDAN